MNHQERLSTLSAQHLNIRALIAGVRRVALELADGADNVQALRTGVNQLRLVMEVHLATEEALLGPVLEGIDAWGSVRLELMNAEHAHQRAILAVLSSARAADLPKELLARRTMGMLEEMLADMDAEDRELLDARVLRDDVIQLDASDC